MFKIGDVLIAKPASIDSYYSWNYTALLVVGVEFAKYSIVILHSRPQSKLPSGYKTQFWKNFIDAKYATVESHV